MHAPTRTHAHSTPAQGVDIGLTACRACHCLGLSTATEAEQEQLIDGRGQPTNSTTGNEWVAITKSQCEQYLDGWVG